MQALRGHAFTGGVKRHDWDTKCDPKKRRERAAKRMTDNPDLRVGEHKCDIVVEVLKPNKPKTA
jgi:hypothetical protein